MSSLTPWLMLILGIIIGWLLAWLLGRSGKKTMESQVAKLQADLSARDKEAAAAKTQLAGVQANADNQVKAANAQVQEAQKRLSDQQSDCAAQVAALNAQLSLAQSDLAAAQAAAQAAAAAAATRSGRFVDALRAPAGPAAPLETDDLTAIKGIGPAFAARLAAAGYRRFADLADANPEEVHRAANVQEWQKVDTADWIDQAKVLALRPRQVQIGDDLTQLEGIGPEYATRLRAAGITTFAQLAAADEARLAEIIHAPGWRRPNYGDWITQARLAAAGDEVGLKALQDQLFSRKGDNLALVEGIGDQSADALKKAGISTYAALAAASPEQIREILSKAGVRAGNVEAWTAEAKLRAAGKRITRGGTRMRTVKPSAERSCPQDLEPVKGIGAVYEQRLYAVGVGTYWELGMLPDDELAGILQVKDFQDVDLAAIKADAMRLAQETNTMGHVWDGSEPDDFEILEGIGPVWERRLYAAGICTYSALAATSPERLAEICQAPAFNRPDYNRWIAQARERVG